MSSLKYGKWFYYALCILAIIIGLCMVVWPQFSARTICRLLGVIVATIGIFTLSMCLRRRAGDLFHYAGLVFGLLATLAGLGLLFRPDVLISLLPALVGIVILLDGLFRLQTALDLRRACLSGWVPVLILAAFSMLFGLLLIFNPFAATSVAMVFIGITLIISGIQNLYTCIYLARHYEHTGQIHTFFFFR